MVEEGPKDPSLRRAVQPMAEADPTQEQEQEDEQQEQQRGQEQLVQQQEHRP